MFETIPLDVDDLVRRYRAGETPREMAQTVAASAETIRRRLREQGELLGRRESGLRYRKRPEAKAQLAAALKKRWDDRELDEEGIVAAYMAGESATSLKTKFHTDIFMVKRIIERRGLPWRDKSKAGHVRVAREGPEVLAERHARASATARGQRKSDAALVNIAAGKQRAQVKVGEGERQLADWLDERGISTVGQLAVGKYNLDLAAEPVTIEVHRNAHHPLSRPRTRPRIADLAELGWLSLYVWITPERGLTERGADEAARLVQLARDDPERFGTYQGIRGNGEPDPGPRPHHRNRVG